MYQRVIVPLDGSRRAEQGHCPTQPALAERWGPTMVLVRVVGFPYLEVDRALSWAMQREGSVHVVQEERAEAEDYLAGESAQLWQSI